MIDLDVRVFEWMHATFGTGPWLAVMCVLTVVGSGWGSVLIVPLFISPRTRAFAVALTATLAANAIVVFTLKAIVRRKRPYLVLPGVHPLVFEAPTDFSFPSGHAAGSFCFATFVAVILVGHAVRASRARKRRVLLAAASLVAALGVGMSRCALGVHFPGDVLAGAVLGTSLGFAGARLHQARVARAQSST
ncbi:MAG: Phosphoesterase, PA-phosphatase related protein [Labilithrix sp.]|nr:Phosphoesterase, PA-phosphatase related protein [Labilithrix sp.]